jgi:hypothetical protein
MNNSKIFIGIFVLLLATFAACTSRWEEHEKQSFKDQCLAGAKGQAFAKPEKYCDCMLEKLMAKHPNPNGLEDMEPDTLVAFAEDCAAQAKEGVVEVVWPPEIEQMFVESCIKMVAEHNQSDAEKKITNAEAYCACSLEKAQAKYPTTEELGKLNADTMKAIGQSCE